MTTTDEGAEEDDAVILKWLDFAYYMGDTNRCANYILKFGSQKDADGISHTTYMSIWDGEVPTDLENLELPTGTFTYAPDQSAGTCDDNTYTRTFTPQGEIVYEFASGTIEISEEGGTYTILAAYTATDGTEFKYKFTGSVTVEDESPHHLPLIEQDIDATFSSAEAIYSGDYYKNGTSLVHFNLTSGNTQLNIQFLTAGAKYSTTVLRPGTYTVRDEQTEGSVISGEEYNYAGWEYRPVGTYCKVTSSTESYGFATGGTIEVGLSGTTYTLDIDMTTSNGKQIRGTYTGIPAFQDATEKEPISQLTEDREVDLSPVTQGRMLYSGHWYGNGMNNWTIYIKDESIDGIDGMIFDFNLPDRGFLPDGIPTGRYEMSSVAKENTLVPGFINTYLAGTWYLWDNADGSYGKIAPIASGWLELSKEGDIWSVEFEVYDDARPAHKIRGSWSGPMRLENDWD